MVHHSLVLNYVVGTVFSLLIIGGPIVVSLMYFLVGLGGSWSTLIRRKYPTPSWQQPVAHALR